MKARYGAEKGEAPMWTLKVCGYTFRGSNCHFARVHASVSMRALALFCS